MPTFNTELTTEILLFSVDALFSIFLLKSYSKISRYINSLQEVSACSVNDKVDKVRSNEPEYVIVRGAVRALGNKIPSMHVPNTNGVVQKLKTSELLIARNSSGYWWDESRPLHQSLNTVPFAIAVGNKLVQVQDVQLADELHLDTIYNNYDRTVHTIAGNMWSLFFGIRQCGIQTTEEMLKEGTVVTGIGDFLTLSDGSQVLMPPANGKPYFITTQSLSCLLRDLQERKTLVGTLLIITGGLAVLFCGLLARRLWAEVKKGHERRELQRQLEKDRRLRRQNVRDEELPENMRCVVCQEKPREVILLPCGHLCLCEDCSAQINDNCPMCRRHIVTRAAAFL